MRLRMLLTEDCNRNCALCCNKQFDLSKLEVAPRDTLVDYEMIILTGGEPMLLGWEKLHNIIMRIRDEKNIHAPLVMYSQWFEDVWSVQNIISMLDGATITIHDNAAMEGFFRLQNKMIEEFDAELSDWNWFKKSLHLNVFEEVTEWRDYMAAPWWQVKSQIEWLDPCPVPENEVFMRADPSLLL